MPVVTGPTAVLGTVVTSGGTELIVGRPAIVTTFGFGGTEDVATNGSAIETGLGYNGWQDVSAYGTATATTVGYGGLENVDLLGTADQTVAANGGQLIVASGGIANKSVATGGGTEAANLGGTANNTASDAGGAINLASPAYNARATADYNSSTEGLTITEYGTSTETWLGNDSAEYFYLTGAPNGGIPISMDSVACYSRGMLILTKVGPVMVETLAIGDRLVTLSGAAMPLRWIGNRSHAGWPLATPMWSSSALTLDP